MDGFTLDPDTGRFLHTHKDIRIPPAGPIYSFNEANFHDYEAPVRRYLDALKEGSSSVGIRLVAVLLVWIETFYIIAYWCASLVWFSLPLISRSNARYIGALVADVHNVLINGGIYGYPATLSNKDGKLRLLYESAPMALIMEQAGGAGSTGQGRILDVTPKAIHQRYGTTIDDAS